ncbi:hypothetical protein WJX73_006676 [Symbiochloris irregularis]|uniref:RRM domain-containing protein n=1 Tax=Symbiochloris irregularis TaxID=706552 RepID=A0AAW1NV83_9CHLO
MADLEAEMARFEAEVSASNNNFSRPPSSTPGPPPPPPPPRAIQPLGASPGPSGPPGPSNWSPSPGPSPRPPGQQMSAPGPPPPQAPQFMPPPSQAQHSARPFRQAPGPPPSFAPQYPPAYQPPPQQGPPAYPPAAPSYMPQQYGAGPPQYNGGYLQPAAYDPTAPDHDSGYEQQAAGPGQAQTVYAAPAFTPTAVAAGGAAFAQKLAMANLAQHLAGSDPVKQEAAMASVQEAIDSQGKKASGKKEKKPAMKRGAAGEKWWDSSMLEWDENDFRIFVGDMGNEVNDDVLTKAFAKYSSVLKCRIVRDKRSNKSKGYGFVSFQDAVEGAKALREMDGKYIGNRPCKLRKSTWQERSADTAGGGKRKADGGHVPKAKRPGVFHK